MNKVRICFPTTQSVVFIDGIRPFPADKVPQSMMCRTGTTVAEVASSGYHAFVRSPTGCIERLFDHGRFRLDVSGPTDSGTSWELAVLLAHAALASGRLLTHEAKEWSDVEEPPVLVCATGQVGPLDLAVGEVAHVAQKVALAYPVLKAARADGLRVILAVPRGNANDIPLSLRQEIEAAGVEIVSPAHARTLAEAMNLPLPAPAEAGTWDYVPGANPYRGLAAFGLEDRPLFFGRQRAREEILSLLQAAAARCRPFVLIHGRSGIGKSSLLRAGLAGDVPERIPLGGQRTWRVIAPDLQGSGSAGSPHSRILSAFDYSPRSGAEALDLLGPGERVLLLLDQVEQALLGLASPETAALGALLQQLVASERVWVIGTIRSDQLDQIDHVPGLAALVRDGGLYRLEPPTLFELSEMICRPAAQVGLSFQTGPHGETLPDRLAQVALATPGGVPFLQVMLMQLAEMADRKGKIPFEAYDRLGGIEEAVKRLAENAVTSLPEELRDEHLLDRTLSALIQIDQDGERVLARSIDTSREPMTPAAVRLLAHLQDRRLLSVETDTSTAQASDPTIEPVGRAGRYRLAHESLIAGWPRLAVLADRLREELILRDWLEAAGREWERANQDPGLLSTSPTRLTRARAALDAARVAFPECARQYLDAAEQQLERHNRSLRTKRRVLWGAAISLPLVVAAAFSYNQSRTAELERDRLAAAAERAEMAAVAADARTRLAEAELLATQQRQARVEAEARASEESARAAKRTSDLYRVRAAEGLALAGETERALSELIEATDTLGSDPTITEGMMDDILISFERVLTQALKMRRKEFGRGAIVFDPDRRIYGSHSISGLLRMDSLGRWHSLSQDSGRREHLYQVLLGSTPQERVVLWLSSEGLLIERGLDTIDCPECSSAVSFADPESFTELAFIPNGGAEQDFRGWRTAVLSDGRLLIAQWAERNKTWETGTDRYAHLFDPRSGNVVPVELNEDRSFDALFARLDQRYLDIDPDLPFEDIEAWRCAGNAPGTERYRIAEAIVEDVQRQSEIGFSWLQCQWTDRSVIVIATNLASVISHRAHFYELELEDDLGDPTVPVEPTTPKHLESVWLDSGSSANQDLWDHVSMVLDDFGATIVTYARRTVRITHEYETQEFQLPDEAVRVVSLGNGRAAALTAEADKTGVWHSITLFDSALEFNDALLLPEPTAAGAANTSQIGTTDDRPVCLEEDLLDRNTDGDRIWTNPRLGPSSVISDFVIEYVNPLCIVPEVITGAYFAVLGDQVALFREDGEYWRSMAQVTPLSGLAPAPPDDVRHSFRVTSNAIIRIDYHSDGWRAYEVLRSQDRIAEAVVSPSGTRAVIATSEDDVSYNLSLYSLTARRLWRDLGTVHRWFEIDFPNDDLAVAGNHHDPSRHRLLSLDEARSMAVWLLDGTGP